MPLSRLKQKKAQVIGEYALTFLLVSATIITMSVYLVRVIQARVSDARSYMLSQIQATDHVGNLRVEYEPYYAQTDAVAVRASNEEARFLPGGHTGVFQKESKEFSSVQSNSFQKPPANAD